MTGFNLKGKNYDEVTRFQLQSCFKPSFDNGDCFRVCHPWCGIPEFQSSRSRIRQKSLQDYKLAANEVHRLVATYYSVRGNLRATLMLSNQGPGSIPVQISLFSKSGVRNDLSPITLTGHEVRAFNLRQYIQPRSGFEEGSLQVEYHGKFLELGGLVNLVDSEQSLSFEEELIEPAKSFSSARLEGVYWLPNNNTEIALALSNTGNSTLTVSISTTGEGQSGSATAIVLAPRETRVLSNDDSQGNQGLRFRGAAGGISINHSGLPGDLAAFGHIREVARGFSNVIDFVDPQKSKSSRLDGAGLRFGSVGGQPLAQAAVVRNTGNAPVTVTGRMPYTTVDGNHQVTNLPTFQLSPGEVKKLNLNLPSSAEVAAAGLEFISSGQPGSIIAAALSHSANRNQVFRVPMRDATTQASSTGHYPWSIDESSATVVYIKNATDAERDFTLHVGYDGGYYTLGVTTIQPGETKLFDVRQLRDAQQPDSNGKVIPLNTQRGQVHWSVRGPETRTLIGRAEQANLTAGISMTSACGVCCPDSFQSTWLTPGSVTGFPGSTTQFLAFRQDRDCYQYIWQYQWADPYGWSCDNTSVATVNTSGFATAGGVGSTYVRNTYYASQYYENVEGCIEVPVSANAAASCSVQDCSKLDGESTMSTGWDIIGTKHKWVQRLLPHTTSFNGRTVTETNPGGGGPDTCWFSTSNRDPFTAVTGGTWTVNSVNEWGADTVGWSHDAVTYYRAQGRAPCDTKFMQTMVINCPSDPLGFLTRPYVTQELKAGIGTTTVSSTRAGQTQTRTYP